MDENAIKPQALSLLWKGRSYRLRHLFSGVQRWEPAPPGRKTESRREHSHPVYHVVLYTEGRGRFNFAGRELPFEPGLLSLTSPGAPHKFGPHEDCGCPVEYRNFTFDMVDSEGIPLEIPFHMLLSAYAGFEHCPEDAPIALSPQELRMLLAALDGALALRLPGETLAGLEAAPAVMGLLAALSSLLRTEHGAAATADSRLLKAKSLLERDFKGRLEASALAKAAGLSKAHFLRAFKAAFGSSPMRFGRRLRLERAKELLAEGGGVKAVAFETGFCDEFHFANAFRREFGEPPSAFRKRARSGRL